MIQKDELIKRIEEVGVSAFNAKISLKTIEDDSIRFDNFDEFVRFVKVNDIKNIFYYYIYAFKEFYFIDEDLQEGIDEDIYKLIKNKIEEYNDKLETIDFTKPVLLCLFTMFNDKVFSLILEDDLEDENNLMKAEDMIEYLQDNYEDVLEQREAEKREKFQVLQDELKEHIFNDRNFKICTNKDLRRNYAENIMRNKQLSKHVEAVAKLGNGMKYNSCVMLVEIIWAEYKNSLKELK